MGVGHWEWWEAIIAHFITYIRAEIAGRLSKWNTTICMERTMEFLILKNLISWDCL